VMTSHSMNVRCGTKLGSALSGLVPHCAMFTQGVALGWPVVAPSGRRKGALGRVQQQSHVNAAKSDVNVRKRGVTGPQGRTILCPEGAVTNQPRATPWVTE